MLAQPAGKSEEPEGIGAIAAVLAVLFRPRLPGAKA